MHGQYIRNRVFIRVEQNICMHVARTVNIFSYFSIWILSKFDYEKQARLSATAEITTASNNNVVVIKNVHHPEKSTKSQRIFMKKSFSGYLLTPLSDLPNSFKKWKLILILSIIYQICCWYAISSLFIADKYKFRQYFETLLFPPPKLLFFV